MTEKEILRPKTGRRLLRGGLPPEGGIEGVEIAGVEVILNHAEGFAKPLIMDDLPFPEEADGGDDVGVIHQPEDIIVGGAGLLLGGHVLGEVGDGVAGGLEGGGGKGHSACGLRPDAGGVIHKVDVKAGFFDLLDGEVAGELVDDGADHLQMRQLIGTTLIVMVGTKLNPQLDIERYLRRCPVAAGREWICSDPMSIYPDPL